MDISDKTIVILSVLLAILFYGFVAYMDGIAVALSVFAITAFTMLLLGLVVCWVSDGDDNTRCMTVNIPRPNENGYCNEKCPFKKSIDLCSVNRAEYKRWDDSLLLAIVPGKGCPWKKEK